MLKTLGKILARSIDFIPVIGPFLMLTGYTLGVDIISGKGFKRLSIKGFGFLGSAIFTLIVNILFFGELLHIAGYIPFPFTLAESAIIMLLVAIAGYTCHAVFLGIDLFQTFEEWLAKRIPFIRRWKEWEDGKKGKKGQ